MFHRHWDPRLNPALRPDEWKRARFWTRVRFFLWTFLLLAVVTAALGYFLYPQDRTRNLTAEDIARLAGEVLLKAPGYRVAVELTGQSTDNLFPAVRLKGEYQRNPQELHLAGDVQTGETRVPVEYYLDGSELYIRHPIDKTWILLKDAELDELTAFYPDNLAAPLISGVRQAEVLSRESLPEGNAVQLRLTLDENVMLPHSPGYRADKTEYVLWVYTEDLRPARFIMRVTPAQGESEHERETTQFAYTLDWDFSRQQPWSVPVAVKEAAQLLESDRTTPPRPEERPADGGDEAGSDGELGGGSDDASGGAPSGESQPPSP